MVSLGCSPVHRRADWDNKHGDASDTERHPKRLHRILKRTYSGIGAKKERCIATIGSFSIHVVACHQQSTGPIRRPHLEVHSLSEVEALT